jgi:ubiquitin-protein ligase
MNRVIEAFLRAQFREGMDLAEQSDLLDLVPLDPPPVVRRYIACFHCTGLVRAPSGEIVEANQFAVAIAFPDDYLRWAEPSQVLTWLSPREVFHPNISNRGPFICIGRMGPGTALVDLLYQIHEIITYNKATVREDDALNVDACQWARANAARLPVDRRPLKRRRTGPAVGVGSAGSACGPTHTPQACGGREPSADGPLAARTPEASACGPKPSAEHSGGRVGSLPSSESGRPVECIGAAVEVDE